MVDPSRISTPTSPCAVTYRVTGSWPGGFLGEVKVTNTSTAAVAAWTLTWTFGGGQTISQAWNGSLVQSGEAVTVTNAAWNGTLAADGGSASFGFLGSWTGGNPVPTSFALNGSGCDRP